MKRDVIAFVLLLMMSSLPALGRVWEPPRGDVEIPLWNGAPPSATRSSGREFETTDTRELVAGRPWVYESNVSRPTITVFSPRTKTGIAIVVFPGGGYQILAMDLEGSEVCNWLTSIGITCILLKYRVPAPRSPPNWGAYPQSAMALQDAQRALGLVRYNAARWHIDPHKVGVLGFSAGGHLAAAVSTHFKRRLYAPIDAADSESCRPDFAIAVYPGHLAADRNLKLNPALPVTNRTPPTFLLQAEDDNVDNVNDSLAYYIGLKNAGVPVEMHLYAHGGHAFGIRRTAAPITQWPSLVKSWLANLIATRSI
jgi:acetyl esterase/lipase